jgi:hypothetical protein
VGIARPGVPRNRAPEAAKPPPRRPVILPWASSSDGRELLASR